MTTQTTKHTAYASAVTVLGTELNSLASGSDSGVSGSGSGTIFDNTTNLYLFADIELILPVQGSARPSGARFTLYVSVAADGTNYSDAGSAFDDAVTVIYLDAVTTARRRLMRDVAIPPALCKFYGNNGTGQAFAASGNIVKVYPHTVASS